jgi:class 3 adenylate cyclase/tetratricopeptide (TPR) repeat protein
MSNAMRGVSERLLPYVPRLVVDWLRDSPTAAHRRIEGSLAFCDVSGFTALTERLAAAGGRAGAEEMGGILNQVFTELLVGAYDQGAALLKYGGDAVLLLFHGPDHALRACRATWSMQSAIARVGRLRTSVGASQLRMSVGVHTGPLDFFLAGSSHRELVVTGPAATCTAQLEAAADAGEILLSRETAEQLSPACLGEVKQGGFLLAAPPGVSHFATFPLGELPDLTVALPPPVVEHVVGGFTGSEHRVVSPGFLQLRGLDQLLAAEGAEAVARELNTVIDGVVEACERHGITFIGTDIAPDGAKAIVVGGAPRAVDDAESRVVLALREALGVSTRLRLRAGAACGRVFAGDYGPPYRRTYSGIGDAVNLAARVMGKAEDGVVLATDALLSAARTPFVTAPLEPFYVKGKGQPVAASAVLAIAERADVGDDTLPFVGREAELGVLVDAAPAAVGGAGRCVELVGAAGAGRTRLLAEAFRDLPQLAVTAVGCDAYAAVTPYAVLRRLLVALLGGGALGDLDNALDRAPDLQPWRPLLGALLGIDVPLTAEVAALDERFRAQRLRDVIVELLVAILDRPTAIVIDDAHLADSGSTAVLTAIAAAAAHRPWLVVLSRRAPNESTAVDSFLSEPLWLAPLSDADLREALLAATDHQSLAEQRIDEVVARAAGNPLYACELLAALRDGDDSSELPDGLESLVAAQIETLPPGARRLLRLAAVCGMVADRQLVTLALGKATAKHPPSDWRALRRFVDVEGEALRFRQVVVRDAAYAGLSFAERRELHARIGAALARDTRGGVVDDDRLALLSFHFHSAGRAGDALHWSEAAGDRASARYATQEAARFYERAVEAGRRLRPRPAERLSRLVLAASQAWFVLGELERSSGVLALLPTQLPPELRADGLLREIKLRLRTGEYSRGLRRLTSLERLCPLLSTSRSGAVLAEVWAQRAFVRHMQGREREAAHWARKAVSIAESSTDGGADARRSLALGYQILDWALVALGEPADERLLDRALAIYEELGELPPQAKILNHMGIGAYYRGEWHRALDCYGRAREVFEQTGDSWFSSIVAGNIAEIYVEQGRLDEATAPTRLALRAANAAGARSFVALWSAQLGRIALRQGRTDEGMELLQEAHDIYAADGEIASTLVVQAQIASALSLAGRSSDAIAAARTALEQLGHVPGAAEAEPLLHRARGFALLDLGLPEEAVAAFRESLAAARKRTARRDIAMALDALVGHADARPEQVREWTAERDQLMSSLGIELLGVRAQPLRLVVPQQAGSGEDVLAG